MINFFAHVTKSSTYKTNSNMIVYLNYYLPFNISFSFYIFFCHTIISISCFFLCEHQHGQPLSSWIVFQQNPQQLAILMLMKKASRFELSCARWNFLSSISISILNKESMAYVYFNRFLACCILRSQTLITKKTSVEMLQKGNISYANKIV